MRQKNLNTRSIKDKSKFSRRILLDEISSKHKGIKLLQTQYDISINDLLSSTTLKKDDQTTSKKNLIVC